MDIKTRTSVLSLTLLLTSSAVKAMDAPDSDELSTPKAKKVHHLEVYFPG